MKAAEKIHGKMDQDWSPQEIGHVAVKEVGPIAHIGLTPDYRRQMVRVITEQAIRTAETGAAKRG